MSRGARLGSLKEIFSVWVVKKIIKDLIIRALTAIR